jgi:ATP-binding cassette subfamily B protein
MTNQTPGSVPGGVSGPGHFRGNIGRIESAGDRRGALRRLAVYLNPHRFQLGLVFIFVTLSTALNLLGPYFMGLAIDDFIASKDVPGLLRTAGLMLAAYVGAWLTGVIESVLMADLSQKAMRDLRQDLFNHLQTLSLSFFDRNPHGDLMSRLTNDLDAMSRVLSQGATQLISGLLTLAGIIVIMFIINPWLTLGAMIFLPLMLGMVGFVGKYTRQRFRTFQREIGQLNGQLEEMISGQRVITAFGQEGSALGKFDQHNETVRDAGVRAQIFAMLIPPMMGVLSNANVAVLVGLGGWLVLNGLASIGTIATFINYSRNFAGPLRQIGNLYNQLQSALAGAERVFEMIDIPPELTDAPDAPALDNIRGEVTFDRVHFSYLPDEPVIKDMSLRADPGQTIALVGPTGAGKTTMINILSRFYDLDSGAILIDGHDIRQVQRHHLRRQLGIVLQDTFLFSGTVMDNIRYGRLDAGDEECIAAARLADADHFISHLPQGYQTMLSERASNLSLGQRQLLAITRAVLSNPRILILDEATSSVDTRTEVRIQAALLRLMAGRTSFVIAHRLSTIRDADLVLVINEGRIIERGTHQELLAQGGFYHNLYISQYKGKLVKELGLTFTPAD